MCRSLSLLSASLFVLVAICVCACAHMPVSCVHMRSCFEFCFCFDYWSFQKEMIGEFSSESITRLVLMCHLNDNHILS